MTYPTSQHLRECYILGRGSVEPVHHDDFLILASAWKNFDGSITVVNNCEMVVGTKINLRPNNRKNKPTSPDYIFGVRRNLISVTEDGKVEVLTTKGE